MTNRRELLVMFTGASLVFTLPGCGGGDRVLQLRPIFGRKVRALGAAWRALHPKLTREPLVELLFPGGIPAQPTPVIIEAIRADFEQGRVTILDGWRLAITEVRVAALVDMVLPPQPD